ncbi:MAG: ERF family protein [Bacteroidaceae bacterium]|nr:ERF family protein [Bacteroidaceae bacterium]
MEEKIIPMQSATIGKLTEALSKFQGSVQQPKLNKSVTVKTNGGGSYKFQYADLAACVAAAAPALQANGLAVIQTIQGQLLVTTLSHTSGEFINSQMPLNSQTLFSTSFQSIGSMITYLKRYAYCAILGLVADDDDDANAACGNQVEYTDGKQSAAKPAARSSAYAKSGVTGAQLKGFMSDMNAKQSIDELMALWSTIVNDHPALKENGQLVNTLFQKSSCLGIAELELCRNTDDIEMLIQRWNDIWPATIAENTPFGNAIANKRNTLAA